MSPASSTESPALLSNYGEEAQLFIKLLEPSDLFKVSPIVGK